MKSIIIIGHGPSLNKAGRGQEIDKHGLVVRLGQTNAWQNVEDYGKKVDILCTTAKTGKVINLREFNTPPRVHTYMWFKKRLRATNFKLNTVERLDPTLIPEFKIISAQMTINFWQKKYKQMDPKPTNFWLTRGTGAIAIIGDFHMWMRETPNKKIKVWGCDNLAAGHSGGFRHGPAGFKRTHQPHDYEAEHRLVKEMEKYYHMEVLYG